MDDITVLGFEFDEANIAHLSDKGIDDALVYEIFAGEPRFREERSGRAASHHMIGPNARGRIWTIAIVETDDERAIWRPITGWPSTSREARRWQDER